MADHVSGGGNPNQPAVPQAYQLVAPNGILVGIEPLIHGAAPAANPNHHEQHHYNPGQLHPFVPENNAGLGHEHRHHVGQPQGAALNHPFAEPFNHQNCGGHQYVGQNLVAIPADGYNDIHDIYDGNAYLQHMHHAAPQPPVDAHQPAPFYQPAALHEPAPIYQPAAAHQSDPFDQLAAAHQPAPFHQHPAAPMPVGYLSDNWNPHVLPAPGPQQPGIPLHNVPHFQHQYQNQGPPAAAPPEPHAHANHPAVLRLHDVTRATPKALVEEIVEEASAILHADHQKMCGHPDGCDRRA
ncbi:hypothetical protein B0T20DRAFT_392420 [Sordaria brevicollis]|uniref:Uncharacterized protein n=1 Tax=Sordaria brevicollis TaxID=83679 RepID=A0AAE0PGB0_SORBR|nr:hypothetical protein B0T20DRAFT_392420 [Sordaria brevicollis]